MQPDSPLFKFHNPDEIATNALRTEAMQETVSKLGQVLLNPAKTETYFMGTLSKGDKSQFISRVDRLLINDFGVMLSSRAGITGRDSAEAKVFEPFEKTTSERNPGVEFTTSVIAFDLYKDDEKRVSYNEDNEKPKPEGSLILFRLGSSEQSPTASDLKLGVNCNFGAIIRNGKIEPFMLKERPSERVVGRLERVDPTSETGMTTDAQLVQTENSTVFEIIMLEGDEHEELEQAVIDELNKFVEYQEGQGQE